MRFLVPAIIFSLSGALATSAPVPDPDASDIDFGQISIDSISYAGSGCKAGTVSFSPRSDWSLFTLQFDHFIASIGPKVPFSDKRKNCNVNVKFRYPQGYQYTVEGIHLTGYATLEQDVKATHQVDYWFAGFGSSRATLKRQWSGVFDGLYDFCETLAPEAWVWSPCDVSTTLNLNHQILLDNSLNPQGSGTTAAEDVLKNTLKALYNVKWRKC